MADILYYNIGNTFRRLTEEERDKVSDNHNLIYSYINMKGLNQEEWYDILAITLIEAVQNYDSERGSTFANFAYRCFDYAMCDVITFSDREKRQPKDKVLSLDYEYINENDEHITLLESIEDKTDNYEPMLNKIMRENFINSQNVTAKQKQIYNMLYDGLTMHEIARILGISHQAVAETRKILQKKYKKFIGE